VTGAADAALDQLVKLLADAVADRVAARLSAGSHAGFVEQAGSPLGRRRHIAAVRRIVAAGQPGAAIVGRRHLLSRERVERELAAVAKRPKKTRAERVDELAELRERFGFERKGAA
jgi:hypothetical protein